MMVRHPLGRFAEVEDVARTIAMMLSPDTAMVNGAVLSVDGGFLAV
jgi:NAD(P)-dependent dehydrogenase (short-subunit alcohol dehydrogenase family)